jgi:hypothetical protein
MEQNISACLKVTIVPSLQEDKTVVKHRVVGFRKINQQHMITVFPIALQEI